jgi:urease accessory protein
MKHPDGTRTLLGSVIFAVPLLAHAHHGMDRAIPASALEGLISGLAHPVIGVDHLLFVLAVGAACYHFGRKAGTLVAFTTAAIAGTLLHLQQATLEYPDAIVASTLVLLGVLFFLGRNFLTSAGALALFAAAGIAHGYAYGEAIVGAEPTPLYGYLLGFTLIQFLIGVVGFAIAGYASRSRPQARTEHAWGGALAVAGVAFLALSLT